jgi:cytoskeletal protein RodZ
MKNVNDENIDELFREGLNPENEGFSSVDNDWSKLEQRLNMRDKRKKLILWLRPLSGIAAILLLFFSFWLLRNSAQKQEDQQIVVQEEIQNSNENQSTSPEEEQELNIGPESKSSSPLNEQTSAENSFEKEKRNDSAIGIISDKVDSLSNKKNNVELLPTVQSNIMNTNGTKESLAEQSGKPNEVQTNETTKPQPLMTEDKSNLQSESGQEQIVKISPEKEPLIIENKIANFPEIDESKSRLLALSILVSTDYNGVNNLSDGQVGNDIGLLMTYGFSKRWSFSTGAIYAKKLYGADYATYTPQKDIWTGYRPKSVDADCRVLDIPLNINYTFLNRNRTSLSVGTGISSYIMLKEFYKFTYYKENTTDPSDYSLVNENQHWFSVLNLQANYTRKLTPGLSLSLQPYMKIPLSEIGFAQVKLESLGLAFSASWNFNL